MVRIVIAEKGLDRRVEIVDAQTRTADSPYYAVNPSGRVPYLVRDDGTGLEESQLICAYLDQLDGSPEFEHPSADAGWESRRLEALARSLLDGLCVWVRELYRPEDERSPTIIEHERQRSRRMLDVWETEIDHPQMRGPLNMAQVTLVCALQLERRNPDLRWRPDHPKLSQWVDAIGRRPSIAATAPPPKPG